MSIFPEDKSTGPGYKWLKWPFKISACLKAAVGWHDEATSKGSSQDKFKIPGSIIDGNFIAQIENCKGEVITSAIWKRIILAVGRWFTEGRYFPKWQSIDNESKIDSDQN